MDYEFFSLLKKEQQQDGVKLRLMSNDTFVEARQLAAQSGMVLVQHSDVHYQLKGQAGWLLNIYPGNQRLYHDRNRPKPPYLDVKLDWNLIDVVHAAIVALKNMDSFSEQIENKVSNDGEENRV